MKFLSNDSFQHFTGILISMIFIIGGLFWGYFVLNHIDGSLSTILLMICGIELVVFGYILYKSIIGFKESFKK